jgi:hypothetical protein
MLSISASRHGLYLYYLSVRKKIALGICLIALVVGASAALATAAPEDLTVTKTNSQRATGQYTTEIAAKDGYTYEPDYESGTVKITNQANPNNPTITFVDDDYLWMPDQIVRNGNVLGVMHYTENGSSMFVTTYDISNAANPVKIATLDLSTAPITCQNSSGLYPANDSVLLVVPCGGQVEVASLDISNPGSLSLADTIDLSSYSWGVNSIQSDGADSHVFFSDNTLYATLDVSDPANLAVTESVDGNVYETMGALQPGTRKVGNYVYTTTWVLGGGEYDIDLRVVDVSNPASPSTVNTLNLCNRPYRDVEMQVLTNQRIITTCDEQLFEINLSSPTAPTLSPKATTLYSYGDMYVDTNGRVYQNADFENFVPSQVYQANGPATMPSFLGANAGDTGMGYNTYFVIPDGSTTAFVFNHELPIVKTVDISDPSDMRVLSTQFLMQNGTFIPDFQFAGSSASLSLSADESHVIIVNADSDAEPSLISVDISNPASISVTDRYLLGSTEFPRANVLDGDVLYSLASNQLRSTRVEADGTFTSLDTQAVTIPAGGNYSYASLSVVNNAAIMTYGVQQARYIDISNPASLGAAQTTNLPVMGNYTYFRTPFVDGNHIYVGIQDTVYAVDASNPASLSISSSVTNADAPDYYGVFRYYDSDELLYGNGNDFAKLNYSNPANISITETTSDGGLYPDALWGFDEVWDVEIAGNYAFGASNIAEGSYYSFDISDLTNPKPLDVLNFQVPFWQPQSLHTVGNTLYVGGRTDWEVNADLSTYSLATPGAPQRTGASVHEFTDIIATASSGSYLYAARDLGRTRRVRYIKPRFPRTASAPWRCWFARRCRNYR